MQMSMRLITLRLKFTYCVPRGTALYEVDSADAVLSAFAPERHHIDAECGRRLAKSRALRQRAQNLLALEVFQPGSARSGAHIGETR